MLDTAYLSHLKRSLQKEETILNYFGEIVTPVYGKISFIHDNCIKTKAIFNEINQFLEGGFCNAFKKNSFVAYISCLEIVSNTESKIIMSSGDRIKELRMKAKLNQK